MRPRPRFSLKWILVSFAFIGFVCHLLFVRPTELAGRLITAVEKSDLNATNQMGLPLIPEDGFNLDSIQLMPHNWSDVLKGRRRVSVRTRNPDPPSPWPRSNQDLAWITILDISTSCLGYRVDRTHTMPFRGPYPMVSRNTR